MKYIDIEWSITEKERDALVAVLETVLDSFDFSGDKESYLQERITKDLLEIISE